MISIVMNHFFYLASNWEPIGMNIEKRHENRNLNSGIVKIFMFFGRLDDNNRSVGRSENQASVVNFNHTVRIAKEKCNKNKQECRNDDVYRKDRLWKLNVDKYINAQLEEAERSKSNLENVARMYDSKWGGL